MDILYLHCGYHKTGSSFLQTMFARNRAYLQENGIHFPFSEREYDMISGNISPGNGSELASALSNSDLTKSSDFIKSKVQEAKNKNCTNLLLSSETLFHTFAEKGTLESLLEISREVGIKHIHGLVYFRDPVSHALSTYKHRAKNGNIDNFSEWLNSDYETMGLLKEFTRYRSKYPIQWNCRKYKAESSFMAESAFKDWMGLSVPSIPEDDEVNVSLTLSEIEAIRSLKKIYPKAVDYLKEEFKSLSGYEKGKDKQLVEAHKNIALSELLIHQSLIGEVNESLREHEELVLQESEHRNDAGQHSEMVLTEEQLQATGRALERAFKGDPLITRMRVLATKVIKKFKRDLIYK